MCVYRLIVSSPWLPVQWEGGSGNSVGDLLVCLGGESRSQAEDECSGIHYGLLALVWEEEEEEEEEEEGGGRCGGREKEERRGGGKRGERGRGGGGEKREIVISVHTCI